MHGRQDDGRERDPQAAPERLPLVGAGEEVPESVQRKALRAADGVDGHDADGIDNQPGEEECEQPT